jgi:hypothetical protein
MLGVFDNHGVRFAYPSNWSVEVSDDGSRTTIALNEPGGTAFALISLDDECPAPSEVADEALEAMRAEYSQLDAYPALEDIDGRRAVGHDVEFFALDFLNACVIRSFRTPRRTVLILEQWSETADGEGLGPIFAAVRKSFQETDADGEEELEEPEDDGPTPTG